MQLLQNPTKFDKVRMKFLRRSNEDSTPMGQRRPPQLPYNYMYGDVRHEMVASVLEKVRSVYGYDVTLEATLRTTEEFLPTYVRCMCNYLEVT